MLGRRLERRCCPTRTRPAFDNEKKGTTRKKGQVKFLEQALPGGSRETSGRRVKFPLVKGDGKRLIDPTREELEASLWDSAG